MTIKLVERKLKDRSSQVKDPDLRLLRPGQRVGAGHFQVESIHVNHSIADSNAFAITTPLGVVLHTGDFKIDYTPPTGTPVSYTHLDVYKRQPQRYHENYRQDSFFGFRRKNNCHPCFQA